MLGLDPYTLHPTPYTLVITSFSCRRALAFRRRRRCLWSLRLEREALRHRLLGRHLHGKIFRDCDVAALALHDFLDQLFLFFLRDLL